MIGDWLSVLTRPFSAVFEFVHYIGVSFDVFKNFLLGKILKTSIRRVLAFLLTVFDFCLFRHDSTYSDRV